MKRILFPNDEKYFLALTGIPNNYPRSPKEINFSSRIDQFTKNETLIKYSPSFSELDGLMEYEQFPDAEAGRKEVENLETLLKATRLNKNYTSTTSKPGVWIAASTIILIVVITALIHQIKMREIHKIYNVAFTAPLSASILNNVNLPFNPDWDRSLSAYSHKDYRNAIEGLSSIEKEQFYSEYALLLKGISLMSEDQFPIAIGMFETVKPQSAIYLHAKWYAALCNLKLNRINTARLIFSELTTSKEWAKNAAEILLKLESID